MVTAVLVAPVLEAAVATIAAGQTAAYAARCANLPAVAAIEAGAKLSVQGIITGLLTAAGLYKQYEALGKQGDLFEAQRDAALSNIAIAERTFTETFLPAYKMAVDYFEKGFRKQWEPVLLKVVTCGTKDCEYVADYDRHTTWARADVGKVVGAAKRAVNGVGVCFAAGSCFNQDYRFAELEARLVVDAKNLGRAFEDALKEKKDTFYWNRLTTSATIAQNIGSLASNIMIQGKGSLINGLQVLGQSATGFDAAVASGFSTLSNQSAFYGGLGASINGLFNGRDAKADSALLLGQSVSVQLPGAPSFFDTEFKNGLAYAPIGVDYLGASMQTQNRSGEVTVNRGFQIAPSADVAINGLN